MSNKLDYIKALCDAGGEVYIVGGAIRNYIYNCLHNTNIPIKDYDYLVRLLSQETIINTLEKIGQVKEVGQAFGIILFTVQGTDKNENIEFALPRTEISTGPGYRDFVVIPDHMMTLEEDFSRRDASINAMALRVYSLNDLKKLDHIEHPIFDANQFVDPYNGINDIANFVWKSVGDPAKRFVEDPTRIMRAFRQSAELKLTIHEETFRAIVENYKVMDALIPQSYVRLYNELLRMIKTKEYIKNLKIMDELGILKFLGIDDSKICYDTICYDESMPDGSKIKLLHKFCMLISPDKMDENVRDWCSNKQIAATNYLTPNDVDFFVAVQQFLPEVTNIDSKYKMLKVIEKVYKTFRNHYIDIITNMITYSLLTKQIDQEQFCTINKYMTECTQYPPSTDQLTLNGNMLMTKWKVKGPQIKKIKESMLDYIFQDKLTNNLNDLEKYMEKYIEENLEELTQRK